MKMREEIKNITISISCGTVALMVLGQFSDICGPYKKKQKTRT
jgi:hypothetical protein